MKYFRHLGLLFGLMILSGIIMAQQVPFGINYQAVARDATGKELTNTNVDIRFSILSGTGLGSLEYQELHSDIATSRYGVFSAVIGNGTPIAGEYEQFSDISWESDNHFLKVEIKFSSEFIEMGTMKFLSVPYALYAAKSLEAGPIGPQGPPGDPASDDQTLGFDGTNLSIAGGNTVNLASLANNPTDEIQYLSIAGDSLSITKGNSIKLQDINIDDADANPTNEIQDLRLLDNKLKITNNPDATEIDLTHLITDGDIDATNEIQDLLLQGNILKITGNGSATSINLSGYLDNTDNQVLMYNPLTHILSITNGTPVDLSDLKEDADADPTNEKITAVSISGSDLIISEGGSNHSVNLSSNMVAFRAKKNMSETGLNIVTDYDFIANNIEYNNGLGYNSSTGIFTAPITGIYSFNVGYYANGSGDIRKLYIFVDGSLYETLQTGINGGMSIHKSITMKLSAGQMVGVKFYTGSSTESGTGTFSGFRVF